VNIELDSIPLNKSSVAEIRNVYNINTSDKRSMVEYDIPGMEGNVFQNLGRSPVMISFDGTLQGKTARSNLEVLRSKFKQGMPLPFNSNISGAADVTKVLIEDLRIEEVAGITERYRYSIVLREYKEPPPEPTTPPSQDEKAKEFAKNVSEKTMEGINYITGKVMDAEGKPKSGVRVIATCSEGEHKGETYEGETNEEGIYRIDDLPPDKYKITVDAEEYEGVEEVVIIGKGKESEEQAKETPEEESPEEDVPEEAEEEPLEESTEENEEESIE
jgi:hypothetical protein